MGDPARAAALLAALAAALPAGCGGGGPPAPAPDAPAGAAKAALPAPTPEEAAAEAAEDAALERLQALKPRVQRLLAAVRETTKHPDAPAPQRLDELAGRVSATSAAVAAATHPTDPVAAILRSQYDDWLAEANAIVEAWRAGKRPPAATPMMGR